MDLNLEKELNKEQQKAVKNGDGRVLVLSGPGSGKTRVLVYRTAYLLEKGIEPENILLLTFTKKAANEMLERVGELVGESADKVLGGTFHHVGNFYLRKYADRIGYDRNYTILDQEDSKNLLDLIIDEVGGKEELPGAKTLQTIISLSKNSDTPLKNILEEKFKNYSSSLESIKNIAREYKNRKRQDNLMDFDDLLINWLKLLKEEDLKKKISGRFKYILVDEYQDTNVIQDKLLKKLSSVHENLLVVGDDSQSIYSFRAAEIRNILDFSDKYPNSKVFRLETNYRSTPEILEVANCIIKKNNLRLDKDLESVKESGKEPIVASPSTSKEESRFVVRKLRSLCSEGDFSDSAVLFRAHYHGAGLELQLTKENIPYIVRGGTRFFEQAHVKDLSSFLKIIVNFRDGPSWLRALKLQSGVGDAYAKRILKTVKQRNSLGEVFEEKEKIIKEVPSRLEDKIKEFLDLLEGFIEKRSLSEAVELVINEWYQEKLENNYDNPRERLEDLKQVAEIASDYESLEKMLADFALSEEFETDREDKENALTLSTIHQAKGLEWKNVFIIGLRENQFPHKKSVEEGLIEEERRLFYVAVTRCKRNLFLTYPVFAKGGRSGTPSRFLREVEEFLKEDWADEEEEIEVIDEDDFRFF